MEEHLILSCFLFLFSEEFSSDTFLLEVQHSAADMPGMSQD